ncbi:MAG: hypothetical protein KGH79_04400 [Patescibacteria group bacterium]|nr:hypothetical protein [Patescibacteria group bacterium]
MNINWGITLSFGNTCASSLCQLGSTVLYIINNVLVPVLFAVSFLVFLFGVFRTYIWSSGDQTAVEQGHKIILWGLIGFFIMLSLWGIVNVVAYSFGLTGASAPPLPTSYPSYLGS